MISPAVYNALLRLSFALAGVTGAWLLISVIRSRGL